MNWSKPSCKVSEFAMISSAHSLLCFALLDYTHHIFWLLGELILKYSTNPKIYVDFLFLHMKFVDKFYSSCTFIKSLKLSSNNCRISLWCNCAINISTNLISKEHYFLYIFTNHWFIYYIWIRIYKSIIYLYLNIKLKCKYIEIKLFYLNYNIEIDKLIIIKK